MGLSLTVSAHQTGLIHWDLQTRIKLSLRFSPRSLVEITYMVSAPLCTEVLRGGGGVRWGRLCGTSHQCMRSSWNDFFAPAQKPEMLYKEQSESSVLGQKFPNSLLLPETISKR